MIYDIAKCLSGNVLGIGVDSKITNILNNNERILECNLLDSKTETKNKSKGKTKKINIKKIRKIFKKKKVDYIICDVETIKKYLKTFVKDSIYINKDMLYIYNIKDGNIKEELIKKYKRYNVIIEKIDNHILKIDNKNAKTNIIKDIFYLMLDTTVNILNALSDLLLN